MSDNIILPDIYEEIKSLKENYPDYPDMEEPSLACGSWAWYNSETREVHPFFCGSARCLRQRCRDMFWWKRIQRLKGAGNFLHNPPNYPGKFFTLTFRPGETDKKSWDNWWKPWNNFRKIIKRKYGYFSYMAILEKHKDNNRVHIHGITNLWMHQREWSTRWEAVGGGPVVDIRMVTDDNFAEYFSKDCGIAGYFGKDNMTQAYLKARRRSIFASRDITAWEKDAKAKAAKTPWALCKEVIYRDGVKLLDKRHERLYTVNSEEVAEMYEEYAKSI